MAQPVRRPTSAQVMISRFPSSSPESDSVLTAQNLDPASDSQPASDSGDSSSISLCPSPAYVLSLFLKNKH